MSAMDSNMRFSELKETARNIFGKHYQYVAEFFFTPYLRCNDERRRRRDSKGEVRPLLVIFVTRRCNVLSDIFRKIFQLDTVWTRSTYPEFYQCYDSQDLCFESIEDEFFFTDSALLAQSKQIGDYYVDHQSFPQIMIFDELLLHGRALNNLLIALESGIQRQVKERLPQLTDWDEALMSERFIRALTLEICVQCDERLLLLPRYQKRLHSWRISPLLEVREMSRRFSMLVAASDNNNVAYSWSVRVNDTAESYYNTHNYLSFQNSDKGFFKRKTKLQFGEIVHYLKPYPDVGSPKALCSIRWKPSNLQDQNGEKTLMYVPFIMFGQVSYKNSLRLHKQILEDLKELNFLSDQDKYLAENDDSNARWISETNDLVLGCLLFFRFFQNSEVANKALPDVSFVARNYASLQNPVKKIRKQLYTLWKWGLQEGQTNRFESYMDLLLSDAPPIWVQEEDASVDITRNGMICKEEIDKISTAVEDAIIQIADETERHAYEKFNSNVFLRDEARSNWGRFYSIADVLQKAQNCLNEKASIDHLITMMAFILHEMDLGIVGMNPAYCEKTGMMKTITRAGEQALFLEPMRYQLYIPVLLEIQKRCRLHILDLEMEIRRFVNHIDADHPKLADQLYHFVVKTESVGGKLADWNFVLFNDSVPQEGFQVSDVFSENVGKQLEYLKEYGKM